MAEVEPASRADRWFEVRAEYERLSSGGMALRTVREFILALLTLGVFLQEFDPKRFCDVLVVRRDTGESVAVFSYDHLGEASRHAESLNARLLKMHVFDFCRELSIPMNAVVGPGSDIVRDPQNMWIPIRAKDRRDVRNANAE